MNSGKETAESLRRKGNERYTGALNLAPPLKVPRLQQAHALYSQSANISTTSDDRASAFKNVAACEAKLAEITPNQDTALQHITQSVRNYHHALINGAGVKPQEWMQAVEETVQNLYVTFSQSLSGFEHSALLVWLNRMTVALSNEVPSLKAAWCLRAAETLLYASVKERQKVGLNSAAFKSCLRLLAEAQFPAQEALRLSKGPECNELHRDAEELLHSLFYETCTCESLQARHLADAAASSSGAEVTEVVWAAADLYKQAIVLTRELDLENEAIACARLANLLHTRLQLKKKAAGYYQTVLQLAEALKPKIVTNEPWYQEAFTAVHRYQQEKAKQDEEERAKQESPYLKELATELEKLNEVFYGAQKHELFLKHVYTAHPPRNKDHTLKEDGEVKECIKTAIVHYHPDKIRAKGHEEKWCVLCSEIVKLLSNWYGNFK